MAGSATQLWQREQVKQSQDYGYQPTNHEPDISGEITDGTALGGSDAITAHSSTTNITCATATFQTDGVVNGDLVAITGSTNNNFEEYRVVSVDSETELTITPALNTAVADGNAAVTACRNLETDIMHIQRQLQRIIGGPTVPHTDTGEWKDKPAITLWEINNGDAEDSLDDAYNNSPSGNKFINIDDGGLLWNDSEIDESTWTVTKSGAITGAGGILDADYTGTINNASDVIAIDLDGVTNAGAGNSVGMTIDGFDVGLVVAGPQLTILDGGLQMDGTAFTVADGTGNVHTDGTMDIESTTTMADTLTFDGALAADRQILSDTVGLTIETTTAGDLELESAGELYISDSRYTTPWPMTDPANTTLTCGGVSLFDALNNICELTVPKALFLENGATILKGDTITIPNSDTYFGNPPASGADSAFSENMAVYANGQRLIAGGAPASGFERDYQEDGSGTGLTTITASRNFPAGTRFVFEIKKA